MVRMCRHSPPHDHAGVDVGDEAHVGHACPGRHVGQVGCPQLVWPAAVKSRSTRSGCRGAPGSRRVVRTRLWPDPLDPLGSHQPGDLVTTDVVTGPACGLPRLPAP